MSEEYIALIDEYRVEKSTKSSADIVAYVLGLTLLIAPFVGKLANIMAVVTLSYFCFVFFSLAVWDLAKLVQRRAQITYRILSVRLQSWSKILERQNRLYLESWERFIRNSFALVKARAL